MPVLKFEIKADYDKVIKLREEIAKLESALDRMSLRAPANQVRDIESRLASAKKEFDNLSRSALLAGANVEDGFRNKIFQASQTVNGLTDRIIRQKEAVRTAAAEVRNLTEAYRQANKNGDANAMAALAPQLAAAKKMLSDEKDAMFMLTQEQARARLSVKQLTDEYKLFKTESGESTEGVENLVASLKGVGLKALGAIGIATGMKEFLGQVVKVRGEFQQIENSLEVMLGDKGKAAALMDEVREFAKVSPLDLKSTAAATQMMLGFNIEAEKVPRFLQAIGDVSMGNAQRFNSLTLAFSQMSAAGKLMGQDLNQMINAGFNPLQQMSQSTGRSISTLKDEMSKGAISAEMVQKAFIDATNAGGKFYQMSERASQTIEGQLSMTQDALDEIFNTIGENSQGVILSSIEGINTLLENFDTVGTVIAGLVATYGAYRAAVIAVTIVEQIRNKTLLSNIAATKAATVAQAAFNAVTKLNPYAATAAALVALGTALYLVYKNTNAAAKEAERLQKRQEEQANQAKDLKDNIESLLTVVRDETKTDEERSLALAKLKELMPEVFNKYTTFIELVKQSAEAIGSETNAINARNAALAGKQNYEADKQREKELKRLLELQRKGISRSKKEMGEWASLDSKYHKELYSGWSGGMKSSESAIEDLLEQTQKTLNSEAGGRRAEINAEWDATLSKSSKLQAARMVNESNRLIGVAKAQGKDYVYVEGVPMPVDELQRRVKAGNARIKALVENENKDFMADAKKDWQTAKKEVESITKNRNDRSLYPDEAAYIKALNEAKKKQEAAEKRYKETGGDPTGKTAKAASKQSDSRQKLNRELEAYEAETQQAQTALMDEGREKRLKIIEDEYNDRLSQIKRQREDWAKENKEAGVKGVGADGLTAEQSKALADRERTALDQKKKDTAEALKEELSAMRSYLAEYGSIEQQKLAITEEYEQKIRDAKTDGEKLSLAKERDSKLAESNLNAITLGIDWNALFSGVGNLSQKMVDPMLKQLQAYVQTDAYKNAGAENQQKVTELIEELRRFSPSFKPETWQELATATANFVEATRNHAQLVEQEKEAYSDLEKAKSQLDKGEITQGKYDRIKEATEKLSEEVVESEKSVRSFSTTLNGVSDSIASGANELTAALNNAKGWKGLDGFSTMNSANDALGAWQADLKTVLAGMQGESLGKTIGKQLSSTVSNALGGMTSGMESILSSGMGSMVGIVAQLPSLILNIVGSIKNMITGALDSLSTLVSFRWVDDLIVSILDSIGNLIDTIFDLPENLYHVFEAVIVDGIGGLFNTIIGRIGNILSFGALSSKGPADWFTNSNGKWVAETTERLTKSNERLRDSVDRLKDEMSGSYGGWKAIDAARRARDDQQKINDQTMEILIAQMRYHGDHGSNASKWNLGKKDYASLNDTLADYAKKYGKDTKKVNSLADIFGLTPEEMDYIRNFNPEMWRVMLTRGKYDKSQYWEDYADLAGAMDEITDKLKESLTQTTFDSLRGSFVDSLMDMTKDAEAFGEDFTEIMMRSMLNAKISDLLDDQIKAFYDKWAEYAESDNRLTDAEMRELQAMWDAITQQGLDIRDSLAAATGYDKTSANQQGSTGGYKTELSEDTGSEIVGRATAALDVLYRMEAQDLERNRLLGSDMISEQLSIAEMTNSQLATMVAQQSEVYTVHVDSRRILAESLLELQQIRENTGAIIKPINSMKSSLEKIEKNTKEMI